MDSGLTLDSASAIAGVNRSTVWRWTQDDEDFATSCVMAADTVVQIALEKIVDAIKAGDTDLAKWWAERRYQPFRKGVEVEEYGTPAKQLKTRTVTCGRWTKEGIEEARRKASLN